MPSLEVVPQEQALGVVAAQAVGHLGQIVGAKREEIGHAGDLARGEGGSGKLDHRPDRDVHFDPEPAVAAVISSSIISRIRISSSAAATSGIIISR